MLKKSKYALPHAIQDLKEGKIMLSTEAEVRHYINAINFAPIVNRIVKEKGWLHEEVLQIVELYKRFLFLQRKYGDHFRLVPTPEIDEVWHAHILYTKEYHDDCEQLFGKYFYHAPEEPMSKQALPKELNMEKCFSDTQELYFKEFGEYIPEVRAYTALGHVVLFIAKFFRKMRRGNKKPRLELALQ